MGISILVSAYQTQNYIEECLDSIQTQIYFHNNNAYEIIVGIDKCPDVLEKLLSIKSKYKNLTIVNMKKNVGTYTVSNTLLDIAQYPWILRFDSDDIMMPNMVHRLFEYKQSQAADVDMLRFGFYNFVNNIINLENIYYRYGNNIHIAHGVVMIKKDIINRYGGFRNWKVGADTELFKRMSGNIVMLTIYESLFFRRIHNKSLTMCEETGQNSELRQGIRNEINKSIFNRETYIEKVTSDYEIVN